jgi:hypothetical protein
MTRRIMGTFLGLVVAVSVFFTAAASAATVTSTFKGQYGKTGMGCLQLLTVNVGEGENCMYNGGPILKVQFISPSPYPYGEGTGPYGQVQYYDSDQKPGAFSTQFKAKPFDGKIHQVIGGSFTVDDNGTADPTDDKIGFDITLRSPGTGDVIRNLGSTNTAAEDRYTTMRQVLAPYKVDSATSNAFGGYTYVIGSAGFPIRLQYHTPYQDDASEPATANPAGVLGPNPCNYNPLGTGDGKYLVTTRRSTRRPSATRTACSATWNAARPSPRRSSWTPCAGSRGRARPRPARSASAAWRATSAPARSAR